MNLTSFRTLFLTAALLILPAHASAKILLGSYYGDEGWNMTQVDHQEAWQGKPDAVVHLFTDWDPLHTGNLFDQQALAVWNHGSVPMISWMPYFGVTTPIDISARIAAGEYDLYLNDWVTRMLTFLAGPDGVYSTADDRRVYLRFAHEMNSNWYMWGIDPSAYIAMWQHVHDIFAAKGIDATRLQWVWSVNNTDHSFYPAEQYYPGDSYVDWLAMDGYNWGISQPSSGWQSPTTVFDGMLTRLHALSPSKPVAISEVGSSSDSAGIDPYADKSQWVFDLFQYTQNKNIGMVVWFNRDKEMDWATFGGQAGDESYLAYNAYASYRLAVATLPDVLLDRNSARLISDADFLSDPTAGTGTGAFTLPPMATNPYASVTLELLSSWTGGYCARAHMASTQDINDWTVDLYLSEPLIGLWGTGYQMLNSHELRATAVNNNYLLHAGEATSFDYCAHGTLQTSVISGIHTTPFTSLQVDTPSLYAQGNFIASWIGGYCFEVIIHNKTAQNQPWLGMLLSLKDSTINTSWNATYAAASGDIVVSPLSWNAMISAMSSINVGFCADGRNHVDMILP